MARYCCHAFVWRIGYGASDVTSRSPKDEGNSCRCRPSFGNQPHPLQRSPGPSWPETPKKSPKCLPGPPAPTPPKDSKKSRESPASLRRVSGKCLESIFGVFRDFLETFWGLGPEAPRDIFETFSAFRARTARETSVRCGLVPFPFFLDFITCMHCDQRWSRGDPGVVDDPPGTTGSLLQVAGLLHSQH